MYKLERFGSVIRLSDNAAIPRDLGNTDYKAFLAWEALGNTAAPADPAPPPTQEDLDISAARAYVKLNALKNMTPTQVIAWVDLNVTDLISAKDAIKTLAIGMGLLARRI